MTTPSAHRSPTGRRLQHSAFTLLELLVAIAIIVILASLSLYAMRGVQDKGKYDKTRVEVAAIANALEQYKSVNDEYPETLTAADDSPNSILPFLGSSKVKIADDGQLIDAFGNRYEYQLEGSNNPVSFDIWSECILTNKADNIGNW